MRDSLPTLALRIGDATEGLSAAQVSLEAFLEANATPPRRASRAAVLLEEVTLNALRHGGAGTVRVTVSLAPDACRLLFEDDGSAFDPVSATLPTPARRLEDAPDGGRGLILLHRFASALDYRRDAGINRLEATITAA